MGQQISETMARRIRWTLTIGWLILIGSLFYDPITAVLTQPDQWVSPFHLNPASASRFKADVCPKRPTPWAP
jgi:hypothetical protein